MALLKHRKVPRQRERDRERGRERERKKSTVFVRSFDETKKVNEINSLAMLIVL